MSDTTSFTLSDSATFQTQALHWAAQFRVVCLLDSNHYQNDPYTTVEWLLAIDALDSYTAEYNSLAGLQNYIDTTGETVFGFLSYDLKNQIEQLHSSNLDSIGFPLIYFFRPRYVMEIKEGKVIINRNYPEAAELYDTIRAYSSNTNAQQYHTPIIQQRTSHDIYIDNVNTIKTQIGEGDFYEMNYCCEWYAADAVIEPISVFEKLNKTARAPFSSFFKLDDKYLLCASPERFLKRLGAKLISQPIKGTIKKGKTAEENKTLKEHLRNDTKEQAENVMIVDLMRNDLAKSATVGTVKVEELFGIYEFETVHQMISTISAEVKDGMKVIDIIRHAFPMGSMTGAPKVEVMKNIEHYEEQKRGLYSGAIGYIMPTGDFDFNVVIRSILYNATDRYLSIQVGSAITYQSEAQKEYEELLLKANAMFEAVGYK